MKSDCSTSTTAPLGPAAVVGLAVGRAFGALAPGELRPRIGSPGASSPSKRRNIGSAEPDVVVLVVGPVVVDVEEAGVLVRVEAAPAYERVAGPERSP